MFNTAILDVVIGMIFVYLLLSLICSAANEMLELWLKNRATDLERGLRELLLDPNGNGLVSEIYNHPLVSGLYAGKYEPKVVGIFRRFFGRVKLPSYIPARNFALALLDTARPAAKDSAGGTAAVTSSRADDQPPDAFTSLRDSIGKIDNADARRALLALVDAADNDVTKARENIEKWFNSAMDRVSGWYKRRSQVIVFIIGTFVAIGVNADSVLIARRLSADKSLRDSVVSAAQDYAKVNAAQSAENANASSNRTETTQPNSAASPSPTPATQTATGNGKENCETKPDTPQCKYEASLEEIKSLALPIGWDSSVEGQQWPGLHFWEGSFYAKWAVQIRVHIFGWLLTALAISLGAPFWFDMLNKFIVIRSTVKPKEKSGEEKSKD
ncbi:MAG TPA: hypothetical protein VI306_12455 [Pyrinomonadaceae bacterium]